MRNPRFVRRILTPAERAVCRTPQSVAGRWAAKEAIAKALDARLSWQEVEVLPGHAGKLVVRVVGFEGVKLHVSISHERAHAAAVAVAERAGQEAL